MKPCKGLEHQETRYHPDTIRRNTISSKAMVTEFTSLIAPNRGSGHSQICMSSAGPRVRPIESPFGKSIKKKGGVSPSLFASGFRRRLEPVDHGEEKHPRRRQAAQNRCRADQQLEHLPSPEPSAASGESTMMTGGAEGHGGAEGRRGRGSDLGNTGPRVVRGRGSGPRVRLGWGRGSGRGRGSRGRGSDLGNREVRTNFPISQV